MYTNELPRINPIKLAEGKYLEPMEAPDVTLETRQLAMYYVLLKAMVTNSGHPDKHFTSSIGRGVDQVFESLGQTWKDIESSGIYNAVPGVLMLPYQSDLFYRTLGMGIFWQSWERSLKERVNDQDMMAVKSLALPLVRSLAEKYRVRLSKGDRINTLHKVITQAPYSEVLVIDYNQAEAYRPGKAK